MTDAALDPRYLELFPQWLRSLGEDAAQVGDELASGAADDDATRSLVAGLNYIFKSLDLIPDGIDDLGYLDDAFVLRVACSQAGAARPELKRGVVQRLGDDAQAVRDFLAEDYRASRGTSRACARARRAAARSRTSSATRPRAPSSCTRSKRGPAPTRCRPSPAITRRW